MHGIMWQILSHFLTLCVKNRLNFFQLIGPAAQPQAFRVVELDGPVHFRIDPTKFIFNCLLGLFPVQTMNNSVHNLFIRPVWQKAYILGPWFL